jgi:UDP-GlcNAc:undecaprenyl-phosphate GlcNAc-1-phosphate transferase
MILVVGVPLFELIFLIGVRIHKGIPCWRGSPDHFALRLQAKGLSKLQTDCVAWAATIILCGTAVFFDTLPLIGQILTILIVLAVSVYCAFLLLQWDVKLLTGATRLRYSKMTGEGGSDTPTHAKKG